MALEFGSIASFRGSNLSIRILYLCFYAISKDYNTNIHYFFYNNSSECKCTQTELGGIQPQKSSQMQVMKNAYVSSSQLDKIFRIDYE